MIFAVDGGGTTFKTCLVDHDGRLSSIEAFPLKPERGIPALRAACDGIFQKRLGETRARGETIDAVGFGCRGIIDSDNCALLDDSGIMNFFAGHSFRELIDADLPVGAENDAVAATMGEAKYGYGKSDGLRNFVLLTLGTGVGGGIIIDRKIYKGHTGMAGHLGHFPVNPEGDLCGCGNVGCVEREFSAGAFMARLASYNESRLEADHIRDVKDLFDKAEAGHGDALQILRRGVKFLARSISGYANALDPEKVILSGGIAQAGPILMNMLYEELDPHLWRKNPREFLAISRLGAEMGMYGAGAVGAAKA